MSETFEAFHLPGLATTEHIDIQARDLTLRVPKLSTADVRTIAAHLRTAKRTLAEVPTADVITAIDAAAELLANPASDIHQDAMRLLPLATGYSPQMCALILERMVTDWRVNALNALLAAEIGDTSRLDDFVDDPDANRRVMVRGPDLCFHVFSGNVPGVAVTSLVRALLVRGASLGKTARDEPVLPVLFARALHASAPTIANAIAVTYWPSEDPDLLAVATAESDVIVVYGGADAVHAIRNAAPANSRVVVHGPRLSIGVVGRTALQQPATARRLAASIARATAIFDQQGCVSPHAVFVQTGGSVEPRELAGFIAEELQHLETSLPKSKLTPAEAAAIRQARTRAEFAAYAGADTAVLPIDDQPFAVIYDPRSAFEVSCLNRVLYVKIFTEIHELADILEEHRLSLQSVALAGMNDQDANMTARALISAGVTRFTSFEQLPFPPATWHHDGGLPLRELVRYIDWELPE